MSASTGSGTGSGSNVAGELRKALSRKGLHPTDEWMASFLATQRPTTPGPALASTATFRLLASNITQTLDNASTAGFPADIHNAAVRDRHLMRGDLIVQIMDVEDMSRGRWEQIEALEAIERGEGSKGRELMRLEQVEANGEEQTPAMRSSSTIAASSRISKGPHKVLMQDVEGATAYGMEMGSIEGLGIGMNLGAKLLLRGAVVARGIVLLEPSTTSWLGGKIEGLHQQWNQDKKQRLVAAIEGQSREEA